MPAAAQQVTITRGPYLQSVSSTSFTVCWRTNVATASHVVYGGSPGAWWYNYTDPTLTTNHEVTISGLTPERNYPYAVGMPTELLTPADPSYTCKTAPLPGANSPVRIWIVGDSGNNNSGSQAVRDRARAWCGPKPPDLWLMLGDNAYSSGTDSDYQSGCFDLFPQELRNWPLYPTRGNHDDLFSGPGNDYLEFFCMPANGQCGGVPSGSESYYSFDWGRVHFICLDSEGSDLSMGGPMMKWVRSDLASTSATWIIGYWHHPPYTKGSHDSDDLGDSGGRMTAMRQNFIPLFDSSGVDLVLTGHSHGYERSYLLNGHYGLSTTLTPAMVLNSGDGRAGGNGPYEKAHLGKYPFEGCIYAVAGCSSEAKGVSTMPCMYTQLSALGSMIVDVDTNRLDARFLDANGAVRDSFEIRKGGTTSVRPGTASTLRLAVPRPNPSHGVVAFEFELPEPGSVTLDVLDAAGRRVARLVHDTQPAGPRVVEWRGTGALGLPASAGLYWAVLHAAGETRVRRVVLAP
jgi:hypothetical protein